MSQSNPASHYNYLPFSHPPFLFSSNALTTLPSPPILKYLLFLRSAGWPDLCDPSSIAALKIRHDAQPSFFRFPFRPGRSCCQCCCTSQQPGLRSDLEPPGSRHTTVRLSLQLRYGRSPSNLHGSFCESGVGLNVIAHHGSKAGHLETPHPPSLPPSTPTFHNMPLTPTLYRQRNFRRARRNSLRQLHLGGLLRSLPRVCPRV